MFHSYLWLVGKKKGKYSRSLSCWSQKRWVGKKQTEFFFFFKKEQQSFMGENNEESAAEISSDHIWSLIEACLTDSLEASRSSMAPFRVSDLNRP